MITFCVRSAQVPGGDFMVDYAGKIAVRLANAGYRSASVSEADRGRATRQHQAPPPVRVPTSGVAGSLTLAVLYQVRHPTPEPIACGQHPPAAPAARTGIPSLSHRGGDGEGRRPSRRTCRAGG